MHTLSFRRSNQERKRPSPYRIIFSHRDFESTTTCNYRLPQTPFQIMSNGQFDVERATAGLVMALFVSAALLLAGLLYFVLRDIDQRAEESSSQNPQAVQVEDVPLDALHARSVSFNANQWS